MGRWRTAVIFLVASACTHSDSYLVAPVGSSAPFITGTDVQLTYNVDQDYWPTWTQDGRGILYSFVDRNGPLHRCIGLLPAGGGSRLWEFCDNRGQRQDTVSSYTAYALDHTGRLLFSEADNMLNPEDLAPLPVVTLWLADTTNLLLRTRLLTLPVKVGTTTVSWFTDLAWLDSTTFIGLGQQFSSVPHCPAPPPSMVCPGRDSVFVDSGGVVLVGHLHGTQTTLDPITGTEGATGYALANGGTTVVFTFKHQLNLFTVPFGGGMIMPVPKLGVDSAFTQAGELLGVTCRSSDCVVAKGGVFLSGAYVGGCASPTCFDFGHYFSPDPIPMELHRVSLATGADEIVGLGSKNTVFATPMVSPVSGDVVVQVGGGWGHLQTFATSSGSDPLAPDGNSNLYRYHGLFP